RPHEMIRKGRLEEIRRKIKRSGIFREPIIVDRKDYIIIDGHHRTEALKKLGARKVPAILVDYGKVRLASRRKGLLVTKELVVETALAGKVFPPKTTRHFVRGRKRALRIPLGELD
ncbi:MAG: ParB N-terminal domain-containing protein, partial [archaeon]